MCGYECEYVNARRISYDGGAVFVPVCMKCHRFVKADATILVGEGGLKPGPNATCANCGRTEMHFEGFNELLEAPAQSDER